MPIVTIPPGTTGPALQTTQIINAKWDLAMDWFRKASDFTDEAVATIGTAPHIQAPVLNQNFTPAKPPTNLQFDDADAILVNFDAKNAELSALIDGAFQKMLGLAFPDMAVMGRALAWCDRAITQGGTGINANVEYALWERGRARVLQQAERDLASSTEKYARAGWPLPPGAMLHEAALIRQDSRDKLAEVSRDISIKSFETEVENVRFAIKTVGDLFSQAINAVGDYAKTVMLAPQTAAQLASSLAGTKNDAARTLVSLYQAQNTALEPFIRLSITDAELKSRAEEANLRAFMDTSQLRAQTVLAQVKMVGDTVAGSLNGIHAGVGNSMTSSVSL